MAISWAFEGNCPRAEDMERVVIGYWTTREQEDPANAFYQEGEMADELARICLDSGDLTRAQAWYRKGHEYGLKEPNISQDRKALWDFRLEHAEARIAARNNDAAEAQKHIAAAQAAIDRMTTSRTAQQAFVPYLTGYVAFYLGDYNKAATDLTQASQNDPFIQCLLGQTYEKLGQKDKALDCYRKAAASTAHNPPAAYAVPFARKKLS
jgi:tetratricopeptide (TPR) repeat protein